MKKVLSKQVIFLLIFISFNLFLVNTLVFGIENNGALTGSIRYSGVMPEKMFISVKVNPEICGSTFSEDIPVNPKNRGVEKAVISLKSKVGGKSPDRKIKSVYLDTKNCRFEPSVVGMELGQFLYIKNSDPILHVFQFNQDEKTLFNVPMPASGNFVRKRIDQPGLMKVKCSIHSFMKGCILVLDTPIYSFSDQNGSFHLTGIKPGKYILTVWHQILETAVQEIEIYPGQNLNLSFDLRLKS